MLRGKWLSLDSRPKRANQIRFRRIYESFKYSLRGTSYDAYLVCSNLIEGPVRAIGQFSDDQSLIRPVASWKNLAREEKLDATCGGLVSAQRRNGGNGDESSIACK